MLRKGMIIPCDKRFLDYDYIVDEDSTEHGVRGHFYHRDDERDLGTDIHTFEMLKSYFDIPEEPAKALEPEIDLWTL